MRTRVVNGMLLVSCAAWACSTDFNESSPPGGHSGTGGAAHAGTADNSAAKAGASANQAGATAGGQTGSGGNAGNSSGGGASDSGGSAGDAGNGGTSILEPLSGAGHVRIAKTGTTFTLLRDEKPYYIKGINGQAHMDLAQRHGANSTHTYNSNNAGAVLDDAKNHGMTVLLGIDLEAKAERYTDQGYKNAKRAEVADLITQHKDHPALLMWALGNELNLGADTEQAWRFVGELAKMIHEGDPNHPTTTLIAGANKVAIEHVVSWAPSIDVLGINTYAAVTNVANDMANSSFKGAYIVSEWGPTGHWEAPTTSWGRPIEQTSDAKAQSYQERYEYISSHRDRGLGSYVFLWAQKQERTPTWYGMFLEEFAEIGLAGESCPTVDVMAHAWSGLWPTNRAPAVTALTLDGKAPTSSVTLGSGQRVSAVVTATDPDADALKFIWEILEEPPVEGNNRHEDRPPRIGSPQSGTSSNITISAPTRSGVYRLFVYVLDGQGHAGTANLPFRVR